MRARLAAWWHSLKTLHRMAESPLRYICFDCGWERDK